MEPTLISANGGFVDAGQDRRLIHCEASILTQTSQRRGIRLLRRGLLFRHTRNNSPQLLGLQLPLNRINVPVHEDDLTQQNARATNKERRLTPEQLVVLNVEALMKARGVTRSELAKRLSDLGFESWRHEKTIRNLFDGQRSLKVDEVFAIAAALNTSLLALTSTDTRLAVFPEESDPGPDMQLSEVMKGAEQYWSIWWGSPRTEIPTNHLDWAAWKPGKAPEWVNSHRRNVESLVKLYRTLGFEPPAPTDALTADQMSQMVDQMRDTLLAEVDE